MEWLSIDILIFHNLEWRFWNCFVMLGWWRVAISVDDKMDNCLPAGGVGKLMNVCFHIINLYCSMSPRFLQESSKKRRSPKHLPCRTMLSILGFLWFNSWPVLPDLVSCSRPNGPNLVFYGPGNVWWSSGAPTIAHHCNNAPLGNKICNLTTWLVSFDWFGFWPVMSVNFWNYQKILRYVRVCNFFG